MASSNLVVFVAMLCFVHPSVSTVHRTAQAIAAMTKLQKCDLQISYTGEEHLRPLVEGLLAEVWRGDSLKSAYTISIEAALAGPQAVLQAVPEDRRRARCLMYTFVSDDAGLLRKYLELRGQEGLFNKAAKHLFVTSDQKVLDDAVYGLEEFRFHAHTVSLRLDDTPCLLDDRSNLLPSGLTCTMAAFYFDTFESFRPTVFRFFKLSAGSKLPADTTENDVFPDVVSDMKGYNFTVATLAYFPFIWMTEGGNDGIEIQMADYLARRNNFNYNLINPPDGAWGKPDANGTWSGLIGHALYGLSNWSMSGIATTPQREEAIDFSYHFVLEYIDWVTPLPKPNPKWPAIFKPFQVETWAATIMVAIISGPVLAIVIHFSGDDPVSNIYGLPRSALYVICMLFKNSNVDNENLPTKPAPRFVLTVWWILCIILPIAYTGNLVAFMTQPGMQAPLDTPAKLLESGLPIGMYNYQGSTTLAFSGTTNEEYKEIWEAKHWITSFADSFEKAIRGEMVFMDYRFGLQAAMSTTYLDVLGRPQLFLANFDTFRFGTGWAFQPRAMFAETMNQGILDMSMTGHIDHWQRQTLFKKIVQNNAAKTAEEKFYKFGSEPPIEPLIFDDLQGPFYMYGFFSALAVIAFLAESTAGCNIGATSARGRRESKDRRTRSRGHGIFHEVSRDLLFSKKPDQVLFHRGELF